MSAYQTSIPTITAACVRIGETIVLDCGGQLTVDRFEAGPEQGEVSLYSGGERYILAMGQAVRTTTGRVCRDC
jgi:hypothetical protein